MGVQFPGKKRYVTLEWPLARDWYRVFSICSRLVGCPPFWHRKQIYMLRAIMEGRYTFYSPEWDDISEAAKHLVSLHFLCISYNIIFLLSTFPISDRPTGFSVHFGQTLHLPSLLPPACQRSPHPNTSYLIFPIFIFHDNCIST